MNAPADLSRKVSLYGGRVISEAVTEVLGIRPYEPRRPPGWNGHVCVNPNLMTVAEMAQDLFFSDVVSTAEELNGLPGFDVGVEEFWWRVNERWDARITSMQKADADGSGPDRLTRSSPGPLPA